MFPSDPLRARSKVSPSPRRKMLLQTAAFFPAVMALMQAPAHGQGVNMGGVGNNIVPDGRTSTRIDVSGSNSSISTSTMSGGNAYNSFSRFDVGGSNTVNLQVPNSANNLVNIVRDAPVNIQGTLNSYQNGRIGGNVVFSDSYGVVVGSRGVINTGSLTIVTPAHGINDKLLGADGKVDNALAARVISGNVPISADGSVVIKGRINADNGVRINAHDVQVAGSYSEAMRSARHRKNFESSVNARGLVEGGAIISRNGSIRIVSTGATSISGVVRTGSTRTASRHSGGGSVSISAGSVNVTRTGRVIAAGRAPAVAIASTQRTTIAGTVAVRPASSRAPGTISVTSDGNVSIASSARLTATGQATTSGGTIRVIASGDLSVESGASFAVNALGSGDGGLLELSAQRTATLGAFNLDGTAASGRAGTLFIDPYDLVINGSGTGSASDTAYSGGMVTNGVSIVLQADHSITVASDGVLDSRRSGGASGDITLTAPNITVAGGGQILAGALGGGTAGSVLFRSYDPSATAPAIPTSSVFMIGTDTNVATITGGSVRFTATAISTSDPLTPANAAITFHNASVAASTDILASANATGGTVAVGTLQNAIPFVAVAGGSVTSSVVVEGNSQLAAARNISLTSTTTAISSATAAPQVSVYGNSPPADAAGAISIVTSNAQAIVRDTASLNAGGAVAIGATNTTHSTAVADAGQSAFLGLAFALNVVDARATASVTDAAVVHAGTTLGVTTTSETLATTSGAASTAGATALFQPSSAIAPYVFSVNGQVGTYVPQVQPYLKTVDGDLQGSGVLGIALVRSQNSAGLSSSAQATANGALTLSSDGRGSSVVTANGAGVVPPTGTANDAIGAAAAINLASISNSATLNQSVQAGATNVYARTTGSAADNVYSATAISGAGGRNVGVSGALATNVLVSNSIARVDSAAAINGGSVDIQSVNRSSMTAIAKPSRGMAGTGNGKLGIGASLALNIGSTRSSADIADGATVSGVSTVSLDAKGDHTVDTQATAGAAGGIAVTPVAAVSLVSNATTATIGALSGGLTTSGDVTVSAGQTATELTVATGLTAGSKVAVGASVGLALIDDSVVATTSTSINSGGSVKFTAVGASLSTVSSTAGVNGAGQPDTAGEASDPDGSVANKLTKLGTDAMGKAQSFAVSTTQTQLSNLTGAGAQSKTTDGRSIAVAAAIGVNAANSTVMAYVPRQVAVSAARLLSVSAISNSDGYVSADGSTAGSTGQFGIGAAVAINLVRSTNSAVLGASTAYASAPPSLISGGAAAGRYAAGAVVVEALKTDLGVTRPSVPTPAPASDGSTTNEPVLPVEPVRSSLGGSGTGRRDEYEATAVSGAGGSKVGAAGSLALDLISSDSIAQVTGAANLTLVPASSNVIAGQTDASLRLTAENYTSSVVNALPANDGRTGGKFGIGASFAINIVGTQTLATLADGATVTGAGNVALGADAAHLMQTLAKQGASGSIAVTPAIALSLTNNETSATIGALTGGLTTTGDVAVTARQIATEATAAGASSSADRAALGAAVAISLANDAVTATTSTGISSGGAVSFAASGASLGIVGATASAAGAAGEDSSAGSGSSGSGGGVGDTITSTATGGLGRLTGETGLLAGLTSKLTGSAASSGDQAKSGEATSSSISVAAAIGVNISTPTVSAYVPASVGIVARGGLSVTSVSNVNGSAVADASAVAVSGSTGTDPAPAAGATGGSTGTGSTGSSGGGAGIGAAVAINVVSSSNTATLGASSALATNGSGTTAGRYQSGSLTVSALQGNLGGDAPAVPTNDAATAPTMGGGTSPPAPTDWTNVFGAQASSGAGGAAIGVAGALGVNVVSSDSTARIAGGSNVTISPVASAASPRGG